MPPEPQSPIRYLRPHVKMKDLHTCWGEGGGLIIYKLPQKLPGLEHIGLSWEGSHLSIAGDLTHGRD